MHDRQRSVGGEEPSFVLLWPLSATCDTQH
ncbi:hypothetical protein E2C01_095676 [Portunus trituberculatus]|uniref:Uncharacterized protein n=1 Tax=Portunus trituberculatus TaxID=210409 RepID=A0A5B7K000_PORTR|nr:hypothetical protein [Portunus trituberculatus]